MLGDVPFRRSWRRFYLFAGGLMAVSFLAVGFGVASALRALPGERPIIVGAPGSVSLDWTTRGLTWRKWEAAKPWAGDASSVDLGSDRWNLLLLRTGRIDHLGPGARTLTPHRYWDVPADNVGKLGGVGMLAAAVLVAYGHHARSRALQGRCAHCGYDLRATPDRCPECGEAPV